MKEEEETRKFCFHTKVGKWFQNAEKEGTHKTNPQKPIKAQCGKASEKANQIVKKVSQNNHLSVHLTQHVTHFLAKSSSSVRQLIMLF